MSSPAPSPKPLAAPAPPTVAARSLRVLVTSVASDSHTWNLVFLQLVLEELGHRVRNLGACVPDDLLVQECLHERPDLVVVSTVNGHGFFDGARLIARIRETPELVGLPVVIGGMLGITGPGGRQRLAELREAGFDGVFEDGGGMTAFRSFTKELTAGGSR